MSFIGGYLAGAAAGTFLTLSVLHCISPASEPMAQLSEDEKQQAVVYDLLRPNTIEIRILSAAEFDRLKIYKNVGAWTDIARRVCRVNLKEGMSVRLTPSTGQAESDIQSANTIFHEIMHCQRGYWHRAWTTSELGEQIKQ